jgi:hypothetical protein
MSIQKMSPVHFPSRFPVGRVKMGGIVVRVGIVSDIHGNWTALQAVIRRMDELGVEVVLGAGDYRPRAGCW